MNHQDFIDWIESNKEVILEQYVEELSFDDMPDHIKEGITTDDVYIWERAFEDWFTTLDIADVPDYFCQRLYERQYE